MGIVLRAIGTISMFLFLAENAGGQDTEQWSEFQFIENVDPITDKVDWVVGSTSTEGATVVVQCFKEHREIRVITLSLQDGAHVTGRQANVRVQLRFDKNPHLELIGHSQNRRVYLFRPEDQIRVLDGLRKYGLAIYRLGSGRVVFAPLDGFNTAMDRMDEKCPWIRTLGAE